MKKAVHYINQFFAGIGGEDKADFKAELRDGKIGPGLALASKLDAEITHTVICGDNYISSNTQQAIDEILTMLENIDFDVFIAGPAFQAGRYGVACGNICQAVEKKFKVPVVTSMHVENPAVEMFKAKMPIFKGGHSAASVKKDTEKMALYVNKILKGEKTKGAEAEGYFERSIRYQVWLEKPVSASRRGVDMLLKKIRNEKYVSELPIPKKELIAIAPAIKDLKNAKIAVLNTGGIVPIDNPDRIQSASATRWGRYDCSSMDRLKGGEFKTIHAGFDPAAADADPNVIVPWDVLKEMEKEGIFGKLHEYFYSTVGTGTTQAEAKRMGQEMLKLLQQANVDGCIMVST